MYDLLDGHFAITHGEVIIAVFLPIFPWEVV